MKNHPKEIRYSKSSTNYRNLKKIFWDENQVLLSLEAKASNFYTGGTERKVCKICRNALQETVDLSQHGTKFKICRICEHLNGFYEEDSRLISYLYDNRFRDGQDYSKNYSGDDFAARASNFYGPKVEFLKEFINIEDNLLLDVGCGAGHFVFEAIKSGFIAKGIDLGMNSVKYGNAEISKNLGVTPLEVVREEEFLANISQFKGGIVSAIGVIEHLKDPKSFAEAFNQSSAEYLFFSIPMFSLSVYLENVFKEVAPRLLTISGGHTHLFSESSYRLLVDMFEADIIAEWRFGSDMLDFSRSLELELDKNGSSSFALSNFKKSFDALIDPLQGVLDRFGNFSEIHALIKRSQHTNYL